MPIIPVTFATKVPKVLLVEICILYVEAPIDAFHPKFTGSDTFIALFAGCDNVGAIGACGIVVKLQTADHELVPPAFVADTCQ